MVVVVVVVSLRITGNRSLFRSRIIFFCVFFYRFFFYLNLFLVRNSTKTNQGVAVVVQEEAEIVWRRLSRIYRILVEISVLDSLVKRYKRNCKVSIQTGQHSFKKLKT